MYCKDCKYWEGNDYYDTGKCYNNKFIEINSKNRRKISPNIGGSVRYGGVEDFCEAFILMDKNFGCIHFAVKEI